jgi:hypothetical protein
MDNPDNELYIHVAHLFCFLCCSIVCPYVLSSVLWCSLRFPHKNDILVTQDDEKENKNTTQYVLGITLRNQTQIT